jgi:hypothetical protein
MEMRTKKPDLSGNTKRRYWHLSKESRNLTQDTMQSMTAVADVLPSDDQRREAVLDDLERTERGAVRNTIAN